MIGFETLQNIGILWMVAGIILIILEVIIPGGFVVFIGISAMITGGLSYFEIIEKISIQYVFWAVSSLLLIIIFRRQVHKWFPALERYNPISDYTEMFGKEVEVICEVGPESEEGRVRFQGTTWKAKSREEVIPAGRRAKTVGKKNITLFITEE